MLTDPCYAHHAGLRADFPSLRPHPVLGKGLSLPETAATFEAGARRLVRRIQACDPRLGLPPLPQKRRAVKRGRFAAKLSFAPPPNGAAVSQPPILARQCTRSRAHPVADRSPRLRAGKLRAGKFSGAYPLAPSPALFQRIVLPHPVLPQIRPPPAPRLSRKPSERRGWSNPISHRLHSAPILPRASRHRRCVRRTLSFPLWVSCVGDLHPPVSRCRRPRTPARTHGLLGPAQPPPRFSACRAPPFPDSPRTLSVCPRPHPGLFLSHLTSRSALTNARAILPRPTSL